jgi:hypothetical protein
MLRMELAAAGSPKVGLESAVPLAAVFQFKVVFHAV